MVIPLTFARHGLDGTPLNIESWYILYSISFAVVSFFFGLALFKKCEARVVKYL